MSDYHPSRPCKHVRFDSALKVRLRPSASNLRPLSRVVRKDCVTFEPFLQALDIWDLDWRNYLRQYYDDGMNLVNPNSDLGLRRYFISRQRLQSLTDNCGRVYLEWKEQVQMINSTILSEILDIDLHRNMNSFLIARTNILHRIAEAIFAWPETEERRWYSLYVTHDSFCEFVHRIESLQKKYKTLSDSVRRIIRKSKKSNANNNTHNKAVSSAPSLKQTCLAN